MALILILSERIGTTSTRGCLVTDDLAGTAQHSHHQE